MALVAEKAASFIIEQLVKRVFDYADTSWWPSAKSMKAEAEKLQAALPQIRAVLAIVQGDQLKQRNSDFDARLWQFRDAIETADDVLDEIKYYELEEKIKARDSKVSGPLSGYKRKLVDFVKNAFVSDGVLNKLREAVKGLEAIASDVGPFLQIANRLNQQLVVDNFRETGSVLAENIVVGREKEKDTIVQWLTAQPDSEMQAHRSACAILGMGGMGKTTLAQLVCKDQKVIENFELITWICVSDNSSVINAKIIIKKIIEDVTRKSCDLDNLNTLQNELKEKVASKKFLIVLDDVWRDDTLSEWEKILPPLRCGERGSKILVTTRMKSVAEMVAGVLEGEHKYLNLDGLKENDFMTLLCIHAFAGTDPNKHQHLHATGKQIAKKLWGCPLAAKIIGGVLNKSLNFEFWNKILNEDIFNIEASKDYIMEILKLSYYHLPTHLQLCFRYCSIFPQDYRFNKAELVKMWMGSGLIPHYEHEKRRPEDVGDEYLDQLTRKTFFNMKPHDKPDRCYYFIHDLLHDLARCVSKGECLRIACNVSVNIPQTTRHLFIEMEKNCMLREIGNLNKLQTLVITCFNHDLDMERELNKMLSEVKSLRLLSLTLKRKQKIPITIGDLIHLRYLSVSCDKLGTSREVIWSPKSMYNLYHLQVVNVEIGMDQNIQERDLKGMSNLINLRYCKFRDPILHKIPGIGKLSSLQELILYDITNKSGSLICELKYLVGLQILSIFGLSSISNPDDAVAAEINRKEGLKSLKLHWSRETSTVSDIEEKVADNLQPSATLNELSISGYAGIRSPCWMNDNSYCNLTYVKLSNCYRWEHLPPLGQLNSLKSLELRSMHAVKQIGYSLYGNYGAYVFPSLRRLIFDGMLEWEEWVGVEDNFFPCLEELAIKGCPKLKKFPSGYHVFPSLRQLEFKKMKEWEEWIGLEDDFLFPCLEKLSINECPKLKRLPVLPPSLRHLEITDTALDTLPTFYHVNADNKIGTSTVTLGLSLFTLQVSRCPNIITLVGSQLLQQPEDFCALKIISIHKCRNLLHMPMGFLRKLMSLTELTVMDCPKLTPCEIQLPTMLKHLAFGPCGDLEPLFIWSLYDLTSLTVLQLHGCASLQSLPPTKVFARMPFLYHLVVISCKELASLNGIEVLTTLKNLLILGCDKLVGLSLRQPPLISQNNQVDLARHRLKLDVLQIDHSSVLLMEPLRSLKFTKSLSIEGDHDSQITSFPEQWLLQNRLSLETFKIYPVPSRQFLPSSMENLRSLRSLYIYDCKMLRSLPNLPPSLKVLKIKQCHPELADLCQRHTGLYWPRISHIPEVEISAYVERASPLL